MSRISADRSEGNDSVNPQNLQPADDPQNENETLHRRRSTKPRKAPAKEKVPLLAPENVIKVAEPGTIDETVNQRRLREFYELQKQFYDLRDKYLARYKQIQDLIIRGAAIQGGQYKVESGMRYVRRPRYKQVVIDLKGEAYQQRVLENTHPHAHFRVRIH